MNNSRVYIALGSNIGDPIANVQAAFGELSKISNLYAVSSLYLTKPWGCLDQSDFINAVAIIETSDTPQQLLEKLKVIEKNMGRQATNIRWGPRLIDLDILLFGNLQIAESSLTIPHPFMLERVFVLAPLAEIDSSYESAYLNLSEDMRLQAKRL